MAAAPLISINPSNNPEGVSFGGVEVELISPPPPPPEMEGDDSEDERRKKKALRRGDSTLELNLEDDQRSQQQSERSHL